MADLQGDRRRRFIDEYLIDMNATRAYRAAYPRCTKDSTARAAASRLLTDPDVKLLLAKRQAEIEKKLHVKQEDIVAALAEIAFADATDYATVSARGTVHYTPTDKLTPAQRKGIQQIKRTKLGVEVIPADRVKALELLGKHLGMFTDKTEITLDVPVLFQGEDEIPD